jgi:hypothetical protein
MAKKIETTSSEKTAKNKRNVAGKSNVRTASGATVKRDESSASASKRSKKTSSEAKTLTTHTQKASIKNSVSKAAATPPPEESKKGNIKKPTKKQSIFKRFLLLFKRKQAKGKIYKTTDGFFNNKERIKKKRRVAVIDQRKDDGAVAVVKIYSKKDKEGKAYIQNLTLYPQDHSSLTEESIVGSQVILGIRTDNKFKALYTTDFTQTDDELTKKELKAVNKGVHNDNKAHRATYNKKMHKWKKHFKK